MRYCSNCGNPVPDDAAFCSNCGAPIAAPQQQEPTVFCRNCGTPMPASSWACPNCGTPVNHSQGQPYDQSYAQPYAQPYDQSYAQPYDQSYGYGQPYNQPYGQPYGGRPPKKRHTGMIVGISVGAVALAALIVAAVIFLPRLFSSSKEPDFVDYQTDLVSERLLDPVSEVLDGHDYSEIKTDLTITASTNDSEIARYLNGSSIALKVDADEDGILLNGGLTLLGSNILNGSLTFEDGKIGIYLPELDSTYYVADADTLFRNLTGASYGYGTSVSLTDMLNGLADADISTDDIQDVLDPYLGELSAILTKDKITVQKNVTVNLEGLNSSAVCTVYSYTPSYQDIQTLLTNLANRLESDQKLRELLNKSVKALGPAAGMTGGGDIQSSLDYYLRNTASQLRSYAPELAQELASVNLTWTLAIEDGTVRRICLAGSDSYGQSGLAYESTGSARKGMDEIYYVFNSSYNYGSGNQIMDCIRHSFTRSGDKITGTINYSDPWNGSLLNLRYDTDISKSSPLGIPYGSYSLNIPYEEVNLSLDVKKGDNGVDHTFSYADSWDNVTITVNATEKTSAKKPDASPMDITNYSEDQLESIVEQMGNSLETNLMPSLMSAFGSDW